MNSAAFVLLVFGATVAYAGILDNHAVYKISNKADGGVLSLKDIDSSTVYLYSDRDAATQKWRAKKPTLMRSEWELKPTSGESNDLAFDSSAGKVQALPTSGDSKYWHISSYGEGAFQVKHYATSLCLTSQGLNHKVTLLACTDSVQQQWRFKEL